MEIKQHTPEQPMSQRWNQKGNEKYLETNKNGNNVLKLMGCYRSSAKREAYSDKCTH